MGLWALTDALPSSWPAGAPPCGDGRTPLVAAARGGTPSSDGPSGNSSCPETVGPPPFRRARPGFRARKSTSAPQPLSTKGRYLISLSLASVIFLKLKHTHRDNFYAWKKLAATDNLMSWRDGWWRRLGRTLRPVRSHATNREQRGPHRTFGEPA